MVRLMSVNETIKKLKLEGYNIKLSDSVDIFRSFVATKENCQPIRVCPFDNGDLVSCIQVGRHYPSTLENALELSKNNDTLSTVF